MNTSPEKLNTFGHIRAKTEHIQPKSEHIARIRVNTCRPAARPRRREPVAAPSLWVPEAANPHGRRVIAHPLDQTCLS